MTKIILFITIFLLGIGINKAASQQLPVSSEGITKIDSSTNDLSDFVHITNIVITGNRKTKSYIILREIQFATGDSIKRDAFKAQIQQARSQVYNTNLFAEVTLTSLLTGFNTVIVYVSVRERWYIYPSPQFQLIDRNLNEWIKVYHADPQRVTYGAKYTQYNLSGRRDELRLAALTGYSRNLSFSYTQPFSNKALTEGFAVAAGFIQNREIPFAVDTFNKFVQYKSPDFARSSVYGSASYILRRGFFRRHIFTLGIQSINILDAGFRTKDTYDYLNSNRNHIVFPDVSYNYRYANTDNINYPLIGRIDGVYILKRGTGFTGGINLLQLEALHKSYNSYGHNWYGVTQVAGKIKFPFTQAFINRRAIGYGSFLLRGLDYYIVDGVAAAVANYTLKKKLFSFDVNVPFKNRYLQKIPFSFFAKTFADAGYAYNQKQFDTRLNNKLLYTGGFGVDVLTFYDITLGLEYGFNQLGEKGIFLRIQGGF